MCFVFFFFCQLWVWVCGLRFISLKCLQSLTGNSCAFRGPRWIGPPPLSLCSVMSSSQSQHSAGTNTVLLPCSHGSQLRVCIFGIQIHVGFVLLRYSRSSHLLLCYFFILQFCLFVSRLERLPEQVSGRWIAVMFAYLVIIRAWLSSHFSLYIYGGLLTCSENLSTSTSSLIRLMEKTKGSNHQCFIFQNVLKLLFHLRQQVPSFTLSLLCSPSGNNMGCGKAV